MNTQSFRSWLLQHLPADGLVQAFIFGSVAKGQPNPKDCDLFLVTKHPAGSSDWLHLRCELADLRERFQVAHDLPLSIELLTSAEYLEWLTWQDPIYGSPKLYILKEND